MYQEVRSNLTTIRQGGELKGSKDESYSSIRKINDLSFEENFRIGNLLFPKFRSSEDKEGLPPVLSRYSEVPVDDLESNCSSSPPDLSKSYVSLEPNDSDVDICIADAKIALAKIISEDEVRLQEFKDGLDSYSLEESDEIDGEMFHSFVTMDHLETFASGRASNIGWNPTQSLSNRLEKSNKVSTSKAELRCIKTKIKRGMEKSRPLCENNIPVFTIDEYDDEDKTTLNEKEISSSESDPEVILIEDRNVKPDENTEKASTNRDGMIIMDKTITLDKQDASFVIIPEETYCEDYDVPGPLKRDEFQSVVECGNRFCVMGCVCSSLSLLKPQSRRCIHLECMFDHVCTIKSKPIYSLLPSPATKDEDNSFEGLKSQSLSMKREIELQKDIIHELGVRLLKKESEIEKLKKQLIDQQFATLERKKNVEVKTDKFNVHRRSVQNGHYVDSLPFKGSMLDSLAKNTTVSIFIRLLMRKMYTPEYLSSKSMKNMKKEHMTAIIDAAKERFSIYRGRKGNESNLTEAKIKLVITSEFNLNHNAKKKSERTLAGLQPA